MSMVVGVISSTLCEPVEFEWIAENELATIRKVVHKLSNGKRMIRYTVCTGNVLWSSKDRYTLKEARAEVQRLKDEAEAAKYYAMYI